jgi:hypothetical protein
MLCRVPMSLFQRRTGHPSTQGPCQWRGQDSHVSEIFLQAAGEPPVSVLLTDLKHKVYPLGKGAGNILDPQKVQGSHGRRKVQKTANIQKVIS